MGKSSRRVGTRWPSARAMAEIEQSGNRKRIRQEMAAMTRDPELFDEWTEPETTPIPREYAS